MKKILLAAFGVMLIGSAVWAVNVNQVGVKSDFATGASVTAVNRVSYTEFNQLVDTIRGIFNKYVKGFHKIGINVEPSDIAALKVKGLIRVKMLEKKPDCDEERWGSIYADKHEGHLFGCNKEGWVQLDTSEPVCE